MADLNAEKECVVIEDAEDNEDQPGPPRAKFKPSACSYEANWFNEPYEQPTKQVINCEIPQEYIQKFQDLIWNHPHDRMVPGYGMTPKELACVSSDGRKGWLVTSHFYWLSRCLNQQQRHTRCFVLDPSVRKEAISKNFSSTSPREIERIIFVMSVGRQDDGVVFFGTDIMQGEHWSVAIVDAKTGDVYYCDTLGWPAPENFLSCILNYTRHLGFKRTNEMKIIMAHEQNLEQHVCSQNCTNYPLQTCSDVCGVIAMVCIAVAALDRKLFALLMNPLDERITLYLTNPTDYSSYLRRVIICWLASSHIDIRRISLRPDFQPYPSPSSLAQTQTTGYKRKYIESVNGEGCSSSKKGSKSTDNVNDYLKENLCSRSNAVQFVKEMTQMFPRAKGAAEVRKRKKEFFDHFVFNSSFLRDKDDAHSTNSYVRELLKFPELNPVIFFKGSGKESPILKEDDVAIGIQTRFQREIMKLYGRKCICVEVIRKSELYGFNVITVSVVYEGTHEVPCAWLISNRNDSQLYKLFFQALKSKIGDLKTEIFIGDMGFSFFKTWIQVFTKPDKKMFCTWEVMRVLNSRMENFIHNEKHREEVRECISVLPSIVDVDLFKKYAGCILQVIRPCSEEFHDYMKTKFVDDSKDAYWASCHRVKGSAPFIPFLLPFSHTLEAVDFHSKVSIDRMDTFIHKFLQLIKYYETKLQIETSQEKLARACRDMSFKHQQPLHNCDIYQSATEEEFYIPATEDSNSCSIVESGLEEGACRVVCEKCKICVHHYVCTCPQYLLVPGGCSHIHFVHTFKKMNKAMGNNSFADSETSSAVPQDGENGIGGLKGDVLKDLGSLRDKVKQCDSPEVLESLHKALKGQLKDGD
ncbi:uncharacterized protein LOC101858211 [Aplysia californica]|uniref:Uncharacterized protein LOC101858211 n=1 Tax=Aplysia californica TaxID=6500 RepID=A0ABM1A7Z4_APLCA|nr:uncharacterized protein LOC101858211 [Aplysia californica]XP_012942583.1 uncharacterized protein LOC101858211 [Aplysia californica]